MSAPNTHDLIVIGNGAAGLGAAREALLVGLSTAYLEKDLFGGLVLNVNELDGKIAGSGAELSAEWLQEVVDLGGESLTGAAESIEREGEDLIVVGDSGRYRARAVIVASGAVLKKLGIPGESELEYKGVSHCADCDGPMFQGQDVVVVGAGDSALQSAMVLTQFCNRVHLIHRGASFRAQPHWIEAVRASDKIEVHLNSEVSEVLGVNGVEAVRVQGQTIACAGFFAFVGLQPTSHFLPGSITRDERGAVLVSESLETTMSGVFAAGVVRAGCGGMLEDALADGVAAARAVRARLSRQSS